MDPVLGNRRMQRFTVKEQTISIHGKTYRIFNINEYGVGFLIDSPEEIEIGAEIEPIIGNGRQSIRVTGIARHISQLEANQTRLHFKSGWVCGTEFTTRHDLAGGKLLREFIAENIDRGNDEPQK